MRLRVGAAHLAAVGIFLLLALWVTAGLWLHPGNGVADNASDQAFFEWALRHGANILAHGQSPFHDASQGYPDGVNLMANTSVLAISLPLSPVTLIFGVRVAFDLALTLGLTLTAAAWYAVLTGPLLRSRAAGWVGGLFCGFGPAIVAHANSHVNLVAQPLIPLLIWRTLALRGPRHVWRNGLVLGLLTVVQYFVAPELLLLTVVSLGIALVVLVLRDRSLLQSWRPFVGSLAVAALVAVCLLAYPLWVEFRGAGAYTRVPNGYRTMGADPLSYLAFARRSLAGSASITAKLAPNPVEENTFLGLPLLIAVVVITIRLRRLPAVPALATVALASAIFSLGGHLVLLQHHTSIPLPWVLAQHLPLLDSIVPARWGLAVFAAVGVLLATATAEVASRPGGFQTLHPLAVIGLVLSLAPLVPTPLPTAHLDAAPAFLGDGGWRAYTAGGRGLMFAPSAAAADPDPIRWDAELGNPIPLTQGYFLTAGPDGTAVLSTPQRPLTALMHEVTGGRETVVTPRLRRQARAELKALRVGAIVLLPDPRQAQYRALLSEVLRTSPTLVDGVELWDTRGLT